MREWSAIIKQWQLERTGLFVAATSLEEPAVVGRAWGGELGRSLEEGAELVTGRWGTSLAHPQLDNMKDACTGNMLWGLSQQQGTEAGT